MEKNVRQSTSSVGKNYLYNLLYQILTIFVPFITTPYVARVLGAEGTGEYSFMLSSVTYFVMLATLGIDIYGQLNCAKYRDDKTILSKLFWEIVFAKGLTTFICLVIYIMIGGISHQSLLFFLFSINLIAVVFDIGWFFQGLEEFKLTIIRNFMVKILSTILIFNFINEQNDLAKYIIIIQGSTLLGNLSLWPYLKGQISFVDFKKLKIRRHWRGSMVYFIPMIATSIYTVLDKSMIGWITKSSLENGFYDQAYKIVMMLVMVVTSLSTVLLPRVTYLNINGQREKANQYLSESLNIIIMVAFPMMAGMIAVASILIPWYLGKGYYESIFIFQIFSILIPLVGLNNAVGKQGLMALNRQKEYNIGVIIGACSNFVLNLILISPFGAAGAAVASVLAEAIILIIFVYLSKQIINIKRLINMILKYGILSTIMGFIVYFCAGYVTESLSGLIILLLIGIMLYVIELIIIKDNICQKYLRIVKLNLRS